ncbi:MAG: TlpA family protein disulfide reductase [Lachnospiraceae bacterium]|jgi:thiol-disulfide isomerase/thioredoxin|nr:TlpA family protein disulfide reductase [Lachnospiraceae bacterium]
MEKRKYGRKLLACILVAVMLCGCADGMGKKGTENEEGSIEAGGEAQKGEEQESVEEPPAEPLVFEGQDLDGNAVTSDIFSQSKLTMINVWATYCNPCLREMPDLGELAGEYDTADFQLIGIVSDVQENGSEDKLEKAVSLVEKTGADYPHLLLNESLYSALVVNVSGVPTTFFVDENGVVLGAVAGSYEKSVWKEIIDGLLEEL